jgi:uncharacterized membrane protein YgcG
MIFLKQFVSYTLMFLLVMILTGCGEDEKPSIILDARRPTLYNPYNLSCSLTQSFAETNIGPDGTLSYIIIDSISVPGEEAKRADEYFEEVANAFRKNSKTELFAEQGVLIYATSHDSLIQLRVGTELDTYMTMRGITAGSRYMKLQNMGKEKGFDYVCPIMMKDAWNEIEHLHNLGFWDKLKLKISITWIGDVLYSIGKPSDSLMGKIPTFTANVIGKIIGKTGSFLIAICVISLLIWLLNTVCEKLLDSTPPADKETMLLEHIEMGKLVFWVKLFLNLIIITPALGTFCYFSNMRTEDILFLKAHNMPFVEMVDWGSLPSSSDKFTYYVFILGFLFFLNYIITPRRLFAYFFHSEGNKAVMLLNRNHTLRDQCVDITRKGKWEFRLFLGTLAIIVTWELLHILFLAILALVAWFSQFFSTDGDSSGDSVSVTSDSSSSFGGGNIPSTGGGAATRTFLNRNQTGSNTQHFGHVGGKSGNSIEYNNSHAEHLNYGDDDNIGKSLAGMGIAQKIAAKLPKEFFKEPFNCTLKRVVKEGIILSCILIISAPFLFNAALTLFFVVYLSVRFPLLLAQEFIYLRHLDNHPGIYRRYSKDDRLTIKSYMPSLLSGDFWFTTFLYSIVVILAYFITFFSSGVISYTLWSFGGQSQNANTQKIEVFMNPDSTYDYKDGERIITFSHYNIAYSFKRTQLGKVLRNDYGYGFVDSLGNEIIPCQYSYATEFFNDRALVKKKAGYPLYGIGREGETIFKTRYNYGECFSGGMAFVTIDPNKDLGGFIDLDGELVIPDIYGLWKDENQDSYYPLFSEGKAKVSFRGKNGFVDSNGTFTAAE